MATEPEKVLDIGILPMSMATRPVDFHFILTEDASHDAWFDVKDGKLLRISFDGYGCLNFKRDVSLPQSIIDSAKEAIKKQLTEKEKIMFGNALVEALQKVPEDEKWMDALKLYHLLEVVKK